MKYICALSSDAREEYIADAYRTLCLPANSVIHFRYQKKYVDDALISKLSSGSLAKDENLNVVIFFCANNRPGQAKVFVPLRLARITHAFVSPGTGLLHAYLSLGDFVNYAAVGLGRSAFDGKFLSERECTPQNDGADWKSRVSEIKQHIPNVSTYFNIREILVGKSQRAARVKHENGQSSYVQLLDDCKCHIRVSAIHTGHSAGHLSITDSGSLVSTMGSFPMEITLEQDDLRIPLLIKALNRKSEHSALRLSPGNDQSTMYSVSVELMVKRGWGKSIVFGASTALLICTSALLLKASYAQLTSSYFIIPVFFVVITLLSSLTYYLFDKK